MSKSIEELKERAIVIKDELQKGQNTADRIGSLFYDIIDFIDTEIINPPVPTTFSVYYGFANPESISGVNGLETKEVEAVAGNYFVTNERNGNQFYIAIPSDKVINKIKIKDGGDFYFPIIEDSSLTIEGTSYKRYVTNGDDLGYEEGYYPFVIS